MSNWGKQDLMYAVNYANATHRNTTKEKLEYLSIWVQRYDLLTGIRKQRRKKVLHVTMLNVVTFLLRLGLLIHFDELLYNNAKVRRYNALSDNHKKEIDSLHLNVPLLISIWSKTNIFWQESYCFSI